MSQNITRIKKRINTISSTRKITNSMKLVSSVKVRKLTKEFTAFANIAASLFPKNALKQCLLHATA